MPRKPNRGGHAAEAAMREPVVQPGELKIKKGLRQARHVAEAAKREPVGQLDELKIEAEVVKPSKETSIAEAQLRVIFNRVYSEALTRLPATLIRTLDQHKGAKQLSDAEKSREFTNQLIQLKNKNSLFLDSGKSIDQITLNKIIETAQALSNLMAKAEQKGLNESEIGIVNSFYVEIHNVKNGTLFGKAWHIIKDFIDKICKVLSISSKGAHGPLAYNGRLKDSFWQHTPNQLIGATVKEEESSAPGIQS
jgi:hypothetical protein